MRVRSTVGAKGSHTPAQLESDLAILAGPDYAGRDIGPDEVAVREMILCHDQVDRSWERFPKAYLERFAETLPGKAVLVGHDTSTAPVGRFFRARVERVKMSIPVPKTPARKESPAPGTKAAPPPPGFEVREQEVLALKAAFYFPTGTPSGQELAALVDTGVYSGVSIGFRYADITCDVCGKSYLSDCPHYLGEVTADGKLVTGTYSGDPAQAEALEGSIVWLGCQPEARIVRGEQDLIATKAARMSGRGAMDVETGGALTPPPAEALAAKALDAAVLQVAEMDTEIHQLKAELAGVKSRLAEAQKLNRQAIDDLAGEIRGDLIRLGQHDELAEQLVTLLAERAEYDRLKRIRDEKRQQVLDRIPAGISGSPERVPESSGDETARRWVPGRGRGGILE